MHRYNTVLFEVINHLTRYFLKSLLCQHHRIILEFPERDKLHNVSLHILLKSRREQWCFISIQRIHASKFI